MTSSLSLLNMKNSLAGWLDNGHHILLNNWVWWQQLFDLYVIEKFQEFFFWENVNLSMGIKLEGFEAFIVSNESSKETP